MKTLQDILKILAFIIIPAIGIAVTICFVVFTLSNISNFLAIGAFGVLLVVWAIIIDKWATWIVENINGFKGE